MEVTSTIKKTRRPVQMLDPRTKVKVISASQARVVLTLTMGVVIPIFSLALSKIAGTLAETHPALAVFAFLLMGCVLSVSLSHLAWAIEDITKSHRQASWALAISFDLALVLGELCHVFADASCSGVISAMMSAVCLLSMFLNCWAFLNQAKARRKVK